MRVDDEELRLPAPVELRPGEVEEVRREVRDIIAALLPDHPFHAVLLMKCRIVVDPSLASCAATDWEIVISPWEWRRLEPADKARTLVHELHHIIERHPARLRRLMQLYPMARRGRLDGSVWLLPYNVAADAKVNQHIEEHLRGSRHGWVMPNDLARLFGVRDAERKSLEEIVREIYMNAGCHVALPGGEQAPRGDVVVEGLAAPYVVQEGDPEIYGREGDEERERALRQAVRDAWTTAKLVGRAPAGLERLVEELTREKVPWRRLLRAALSPSAEGEAHRTYTRPPRRVEAEGGLILPSRRAHGVERLVVLMDTSGSIGEEELRQFASEVHAMVRGAAREVVVVPWDAAAYDPIPIRGPQDARRIRLSGGGGTAIAPALRAALRMRPDITVILSDFHISDIGRREVLDMLRELARRGQLIMVTTSAQPPSVPGAASLKVDL